MVNSFAEFCEKLIENGFSMGGGNPKGIYGIVSFDWKNPIPGCPIVWHTGEPYGWNSTVFTKVEDFWGEDIKKFIG